MEDKLLKLLAPLEKEEQIVVKLDSLLCVSSRLVIFPTQSPHKHTHQDHQCNASVYSWTLLGKILNNQTMFFFLLQSLGIEERDVPKLAHFLLKYNQQQREQRQVRRERDEEHNGRMPHQTSSHLEFCLCKM